MERPQVKNQTRQRIITGEILYLDEMRRQNEFPKLFSELGNTAIQSYEAQADGYAKKSRPDIMNDYEKFDNAPSEVAASCTELANELLALKDPDSRLTFVDIAVEASPSTVLEKLKTINAGSVISAEDEQLAIESNGEYYPILDIRKQNSELAGVSLRTWGWDDAKYVFTNNEDEQYEYSKHALVYPSDEKSSIRELEISFSYDGEESGGFSESISLYISPNGAATISSKVWATAYAETGYEGHKRVSLDSPTDEDIAAFGDLVAEIVGDQPETVSDKINQQLRKIIDAAATPVAQQVIRDLIEVTWPDEASSILNSKSRDDAAKSIAEQLCDERTADAASAVVRMVINEWSENSDNDE